MVRNKLNHNMKQIFLYVLQSTLVISNLIPKALQFPPIIKQINRVVTLRTLTLLSFNP